MKQSTKLGATSFSLDTELPLETGSLGEGSGVETQQNQIPVGAIIGVVLPVLDRKLSLETVLGIPTPTRFKATGKLAKTIFETVWETGKAPEEIVREQGIEVVGSEDQLSPIVDEVIGRNGKLVEAIVQKGEHGKINALIGQVMGATKGQAKPDLVQKMIRKKLGID